MVTLRPGLVVLVRFPFLSFFRKLRPAVVLAHAGGVDWVLCQVTSNPYGDPTAIPLNTVAFRTGTLNRDSFARPGKLFTASAAIVAREAATLTDAAHRTVVQAVVPLVQSGLR